MGFNMISISSLVRCSCFFLSCISSVKSFSATSTSTSTSFKSKSPIFEYLKFDKSPSFDVLEKTKEHIENRNPDIYDSEYVLRGPVIGPINQADLKSSQKDLGIGAAFPDLKIDRFGYSIDPENPYRCLYFERWRATHTGDLDISGSKTIPATGNSMESPLATHSIVWTPEGKIIYESVGAVVDRFEGNTAGKAAVFGLLHTAGLELPAQPGSRRFSLIQKLGHMLGGRGRSFSEEKDIPTWWVSKSRGAEKTDQF